MNAVIMVVIDFDFKTEINDIVLFDWYYSILNLYRVFYSLLADCHFDKSCSIEIPERNELHFRTHNSLLFYLGRLRLA